MAEQKGESRQTAEQAWRQLYKGVVLPEKKAWLDGGAAFCKMLLRRWLTESIHGMEEFLGTLPPPLPKATAAPVTTKTEAVQ